MCLIGIQREFWERDFVAKGHTVVKLLKFFKLNTKLIVKVLHEINTIFTQKSCFLPITELWSHDEINSIPYVFPNSDNLKSAGTLRRGHEK